MLARSYPVWYLGSESRALYHHMTLTVPTACGNMSATWNDRLFPLVLGEASARRAVVVSVLGLLVLASGAFLLGAEVGLSPPWIVLALSIAVLAGWWGAGLIPTIGSLWLISLWWFVFPPLVGYLTAGWATPSRYTHPRMMGFAYSSARAELLGGLEYGLKFGLLFAVVGGTIAYGVGAIATRLWTNIVDG